MLKLMDKKIFTISNEFLYQAIIIPDIQRPNYTLKITNYMETAYIKQQLNLMIISKD